MVLNNLVAVPLSAEAYLLTYDCDAAVTKDDYIISEEYVYYIDEEYAYVEDTEEDTDEEVMAIYADVYVGVVAAISGEFGFNTFNNGNSTQNPNLANHMQNYSIIRMWTQVDGVNTPVPFDVVTATLPNGDCAMDYVVVNRMWVQGVGWTDYVNFIDVFKATAGTPNAWHWIDLVATYDGQEATNRLFNNYRVFGLHIYNNGPGGSPSTPNANLAANGTIRMWTQIDGVSSLIPYESLTVSALDQDGNDAMQFINLNNMWTNPGMVNMINANKNGVWQWIDLTVTHMDQTHTLRLVNSKFLSLHVFNNGPNGSPSTPNASLATSGTIRIWTQLMGANAQVPRAQVEAGMTATIRESGECALHLILLRPITGDLVGSIDVNKNAPWEFIDFSVTVFGQTIELELHNSRFFSLDIFNNGQLGTPSTTNESLAEAGLIRMWTQLMREDAPVPRPAQSYITATIRGSGECAMHLLVLHPANGDTVATIDANKNDLWEFIYLTVTIFGQTVEVLLHNGNFQAGIPVTVNFPGVNNATVQHRHHLSQTWTDFPGGPFANYAKVILPEGSNQIQLIREATPGQGRQAYPVFHSFPLDDGPITLNATTATLTLIGGSFDLEFALNLGTYPGNDRATIYLGDELEFGVFAHNRAAHNVHVWAPSVGLHVIPFNEISAPLGEADVVNLSEYTYTITVPDGFANVRMWVPGLIAYGVGAGHQMNLLRTYGSGNMHFTIDGRTYYHVNFILDGYCPFGRVIILNFPGAQGITEIRTQMTGHGWTNRTDLNIADSFAFVNTKWITPQNTDLLFIQLFAPGLSFSMHHPTGGVPLFTIIDIPVTEITVINDLGCNVHVATQQTGAPGQNAPGRTGVWVTGNGTEVSFWTFNYGSHWVRAGAPVNNHPFITIDGLAPDARVYISDFFACEICDLCPYSGECICSDARTITFNFPGMHNMIVRYWIPGTGWHNLDGGPFDNYAEFSALGATVVRAVRDGLVYSHEITQDGDYTIDAPVIQLYVRGMPVSGNTLGVVGGGFGSNWVYNGIPAEVYPNESSFTVFNNRTYSVVLNRTGFFPLSRTSSEGYSDGYEYLYVNLSEYLVYITVPEGISNVRMQSNGWIINPAQEGDVIWLVVDHPNYRDATVTFDYCCLVQHRVDFLIDGHNPLYVECCDENGYGVFWVTIYFDAGGGTGEMDYVVLPAGSEFMLPANGFTAPAGGHEFFGWFVTGFADPGGGMNPGDDMIVGVVNWNTTVTVTAVWLPPPNQYQVSFNANGGSGTMDSVTVVSGGTFILPENKFTAPEAPEGYVYEFYGWWVQGYADPLGTLFPNGYVYITVGGSVSVYASWDRVAEGTPCDCDPCDCEICTCVLDLRIINHEPGVDGAQDRVTVELIGAKFLVPYELDSFSVVIRHAQGYRVINASDFVNNYDASKYYYFSSTINFIDAMLIYNDTQATIIFTQWLRV